MSDMEHRCSEIECIYIGQRTDASMCRCHVPLHKMMEVRIERLTAALDELYATVKGECPSLLNEDSGGNARLDLEIHGLLSHVGSAGKPQ